MCGIFGVVTRSLGDTVARAIERGSRALAHRGPDDDGVELLIDECRGWTVGFAHRRLSILDPTPAGHQPMVDEQNGNLIVYNGEVFNFRELRRTMERDGVGFQSETDTEVVLKGFGRSGKGWREAIRPWRGMFAFGLWNRTEGNLSLVRDRLGIKPLYYFQSKDYFVFGSELRSLLESGLVPRRLSLPAVDSFLRFGSVQDPLTMIEGVWSVLPGHRILYQDDKISSQSYWEISGGEDSGEKLTREETVERITALTREAIRLRTVADVPIGVFLSGGIDSSAIVSLLRQTWSGELRTFSISFTETEFSEESYAEEAAERYSTEHTSIRLAEEEILSRLTVAMDALDQPSIDGINTWFVSSASASAGMKVALSGVGGDEVFLGYSLFRSIRRDERWQKLARRLPAGVQWLAGSAIGRISGGSAMAKAGELLRNAALGESPVWLRRQLFGRKQRSALLGEASGVDDSATAEVLNSWYRRQLERCSGADPINQASALELGGYLPNTLLRDTDVMSMAHGLEVRVPLLDHLLVEQVLRLPGEFKLGRKGSRSKWLLVEAAGDLPPRLVERRKQGFELPFDQWLRGPLQPLARDLLSDTMLTGILDPVVAQSIWDDFTARRVTWSRAWALIVLAHWARQNLGGAV